MSAPGFDAFSPIAHNVKHIAYVDVPGGGQVFVSNGRAFVGHMAPPAGTTVVDVTDPAKPSVVGFLSVPQNRHSHKVRVHDNIMLVNSEAYRAPDFTDGGLRVFDIRDPSKPQQIGFFPVVGKGVHRFDSDGKYAYLSASADGYHGNIVIIVDIGDPKNPREVSRWWRKGQWTAGGEKPDWGNRNVACHHPLRFGDRLYVSYLQGGVVILDISDLKSPKLIGQYDYHPAFECITHTFARVPVKIGGLDVAVVVDEAPLRAREGQVPAFVWLFDVTDETNPRPFATYAMKSEDTPYRDDGRDPQPRFGAHQCHERMSDHYAYVTWFRGGLRIVDLRNPDGPTTAGYFIPTPGKGETTVQSNDVFVDDRGYIYLLDRLRGLNILKFEPES